MKKVIISLLVFTVLLMGLIIPMTTGAVPASGISATKTTVSPGDTLTVSLTVPGTQTLISDMTLKMTFNKDAFEVTSIDASAITGMTKTAATVSEANANGAVAAVYGSENYEADVSIASGVTLSATFTVKADAAPDAYNFAVSNDFAVSSLDGMGMPDPVLTYADVTNKSVTVTVQSAATTYTVTFAANGGSGNMTAVEGVSGTYILPQCGFTAPTDKQFKCWSVGGEEKYVGYDITVTEDTVVTALWKNQTFDVNFYLSPTATTPLFGLSIEKGSCVPKPEDPEQDDFTFGGWCIDKACQNVYDFSAPVTENLNLYAKWVPVVATYTVSFVANGATGNMTPVSGISGNYELPACTFTAPANKQFKCWSVGGKEKAAGDTVNVTADTVVTAIWEDIPHVHNLSHVPAKSATATEAGNQEYYVCTGCGKWFADALGQEEITYHSSVIIPPTGSADPAEYHVTDGADSEWTEKSGKDVVIATDADPDKVVSVKVDGTELSQDDYTIDAVTGKVSVRPGFLNGLTVGKHTVTIVLNDGEATTDVTVTAAPQNSGTNSGNGDNTTTDTGTQNASSGTDSGTGSPKTSDNSHIEFWIVALILSVIAIAGLGFFLKKKKTV